MAIHCARQRAAKRQALSGNDARLRRRSAGELPGKNLNRRQEISFMKKRSFSLATVVAALA
jgi:hypothetical protein